MEKETLFRNIFREYEDDTRLPLFRHLFDTIDDESETLDELEVALFNFATEAWVRTHDDLSIGEFDDFCAWWENTDKSEWHEQVKSWMKKVMGEYYDAYDIERRFQEGGDPLSELKEYMSVLGESVKFDLGGGFMSYDDFFDPTGAGFVASYDAQWVYEGVTDTLAMKRVESAKAAQH